MAQPEEFLPACPVPLVIQPHERVEWLKERLKEPENQRQKVNILALIKMYESGELGPFTPGHTIYICDGKIIDDPLHRNFCADDAAKFTLGNMGFDRGATVQIIGDKSNSCYFVIGDDERTTRINI